MLRIIIYLFFVSILLFSCVPDKSSPTESEPPAEPVKPEATKWIIDNAHLLTDIDRTGYYYDLMPLDSIIGNSKIVSLGGATYGTHECPKLKIRIIDYLVNQKDFNVVLFDSDYPETDDLSYFVKTGQGNVTDLLYKVFWWRSQIKDNNIFWICQEIADLMHWIKKHNQFLSDENKIKLYGYGVQRPQKAMSDVIEYFETVDSSTAEYVKTNYNRFKNFSHRYPVVGQYVMADCRNGSIAVMDTLEKNRNIYEPISGVESFERALFLANYVIRSEQALRKDMEDLENTFRYEMIKYLIDNSDQNSKFIIWGQNNTIGYHPNRMGELLKNEYGQDLKSIGFSMHNGYFYASLLNPDDGSYSWPCLFENPVPPEDSYESILHSSEIPCFVLDLNSNLEPQGDPATDWLYTAKKFNSIEKFYEPNRPAKYFQEISLKNTFDILIHVDQTSLSELFIY